MGRRTAPLGLAAAFALVIAGCAGPVGSPPTPAPGGTGTIPSAGAATPTAAGSGTPGPSAAAAGGPGTPTPMPVGPDGRPFVAQEMARFGEPWALTFLPGTDLLLITERSGRLHLRDQASGQVTEVAGTPEVVSAGQGGLGDVVPGPTFPTDQTVYLSWVERGQGGTGAAVGRARLVTAGGPRLDGLEVIWRQTPKVSGSGHFSHRLAFSPDGAHLFVSSGDRQKFDPAQDPGNTLGTVVRLTPDGRPAPGNPFADRGSPADEIWSYGHRNPLGLAFAPDGNLWVSEMGPQGGDELNLVVRGANYGWPRASNGSHYGGGPIPDHTPGDGFEAPRVFWTPSVSPGSLLVYSGDLFPGWTGDALIGALSGEALIRVDLDGTTATLADTWPMGERIREVEQAPDGAVWLLEDAGAGRLLRLSPPAG